MQNENSYGRQGRYAVKLCHICQEKHKIVSEVFNIFTRYTGAEYVNNV
jgi:hypothetical protein